MKPTATPAAINALYVRSIRLSEALLVYADMLPELSPLLKRELELVADKVNDVAIKLREIKDCHTDKLIKQQGGAQ